MLNWRIYYGDGTTYDETDGPAEEAPAWGTVAVVTRNSNDPREIVSVQGTGFDYFVYDKNNDWWGADFIGLIDRLADRSAKVVCFGRTIEPHKYEQIIAKSVKDKLE